MGRDRRRYRLTLVLLLLAPSLTGVRAQPAQPPAQGAQAPQGPSVTPAAGEWRAYGGESRQHEVLTARPDHRGQFRHAEAGVAREVARSLAEPDAPRRRRAGRNLARQSSISSRSSIRRDGGTTSRPTSATSRPRRSWWAAAVPEFTDIGRRRTRRAHGRDALGLQPQELREGHDDDERAVEPARRRVLDRWKGGAGATGARATATWWPSTRGPACRWRASANRAASI